MVVEPKKSSPGVRQLSVDDPLWDTVAETLMGEYGQDRAFMGKPPSVVLASVRGEQPEGFCIFRDMRDPEQHQGTMFDIAATHSLLEMEGVGLFRIALIHSFCGPAHLAPLTRQLIGSSEEILSRDYPNHALLIPLLRKANAPAFALWKQLGFKERGLCSTLLETDLTLHAGAVPSVSLPDQVTVRFMDGMDTLPVRGIAECYARVFLHASETGVAEKMVSSIVRGKGFSPDLSMLAFHGDEERVVGFFLAEQLSSRRSINITVVGIEKAFRARGLNFYGFPLFVSRCLDRQVTCATQVTSTKGVVRLVCGRLGGRVVDEMVWMIRVR